MPSLRRLSSMTTQSIVAAPQGKAIYCIAARFALPATPPRAPRTSCRVVLGAASKLTPALQMGHLSSLS
jgi:hypothetical protein